MPLTANGYEARRAAQILNEIRADFEELAGFTPDWEADRVYGLLTVLMALQIEQLEDSVQQFYDSLDPETANGIFLENISRLTAGFGRREATRSRVEIQLNGTPTTEISAGDLQVRDDNRNVWELVEDATLDGAFLFEAVEFGPVSIGGTTTFNIITPVSGLDEAVYSADAELGLTRETDAQLRARRRGAVKLGRYGSGPLLRRRLLNLSFITNATVLQNDTSVPVTTDGVLLNDKSLAIVVYPTSLTATELQALAQTIVTSAPAGIEQMGDQTESFVVDGVSYDAVFSYPTETTVDITVAATADEAFDTAEVDAEIESQLTSYLENLLPGDDVRLLEIYGIIDDVDGVVSVTALTVNGGSADVAIGATEIARPGTISATVT